MDELLVLFGGSLLLLGLFGRVIKRVLLTSVLLAVLIGIAAGPHGLGLLAADGGAEQRELLHQVARLTLALALMAAGLEVARSDLRACARPVLLLLGVGMIGMWLSVGLGAWLLLGLSPWAALLLGGLLTPTDPVVANTLVTGPMATKNLSRRLRRTLQLEAGANDGLALPLVMLGVVMLEPAGGGGLAQMAADVAREVATAVVVGLLVGLLAGWLVEWSVRHSEIEEPNLLGMGIALALSTLGLVHLLGGSGVLAVFVSALAFSVLLESRVRDELEEVQEGISQFAVLPLFILFGAMLPWDAWSRFGLAEVLFLGWVLLLRRPPIVVPLIAVGSGKRGDRRDAVFLGWFGPLGAAAIFYVTHVEVATAGSAGPLLFPLATAAICASVLMHSITATPGVRMRGGHSPFGSLRHPLREAADDAP